MKAVVLSMTTTSSFRIALILPLFGMLFLHTQRAAAQNASATTSNPGAAAGPLLNVSFTGTHEAGVNSIEVDLATGYQFNPKWSLTFGLPILTTTGSGVSANGIGDSYGSLNYQTGSAIQSTSAFTVSAPTGSKTKGLTNGHMGVSLDERLETENFTVNPFVEVGVANNNSLSVLQIRRVRAYSSSGEQADSQAGLGWSAGALSLSVAGYDVAGISRQIVYSRIAGSSAASKSHSMTKHAAPNLALKSVSGPSTLVNDYGAVGELDYDLTPNVSLGANYARSVYYGSNSASFSVNFDVMGMLHHAQKH